MNATLVKICGVRSPDIARHVESMGADLMGLILAPSRRRVTIEEATGIVAAIERRTKVVGVFVNESVDAMNDIVDRLDLDYVQLSGDEPAEVQAQIRRPVIRALRLPPGTSIDHACRQADAFLTGTSPAHALLLDTHVDGVYGGTGSAGDWDLAAGLAERFPVILAGGLSPENVDRALELVNPLGLDVSSGVETGGQKDPAKISQFIDSVRGTRRHQAATQRNSSSRLIRAFG